MPPDIAGNAIRFYLQMQNQVAGPLRAAQSDYRRAVRSIEQLNGQLNRSFDKINQRVSDTLSGINQMPGAIDKAYRASGKGSSGRSAGGGAANQQAKAGGGFLQDVVKNTAMVGIIAKLAMPLLQRMVRQISPMQYMRMQRLMERRLSRRLPQADRQMDKTLEKKVRTSVQKINKRANNDKALQLRLMFDTSTLAKNLEKQLTDALGRVKLSLDLEDAIGDLVELRDVLDGIDARQKITLDTKDATAAIEKLGQTLQDNLDALTLSIDQASVAQQARQTQRTLQDNLEAVDVRLDQASIANQFRSSLIGVAETAIPVSVGFRKAAGAESLSQPIAEGITSGLNQGMGQLSSIFDRAAQSMSSAASAIESVSEAIFRQIANQAGAEARASTGSTGFADLGEIQSMKREDVQKELAGGRGTTAKLAFSGKNFQALTEYAVQQGVSLKDAAALVASTLVDKLKTGNTGRADTLGGISRQAFREVVGKKTTEIGSGNVLLPGGDLKPGETGKPKKGDGITYGFEIPSFQIAHDQGGFVQGAGIATLHPAEVIIGLDPLQEMIQMAVGGGIRDAVSQLGGSISGQRDLAAVQEVMRSNRAAQKDMLEDSMRAASGTQDEMIEILEQINKNLEGGDGNRGRMSDPLTAIGGGLLSPGVIGAVGAAGLISQVMQGERSTIRTAGMLAGSGRGMANADAIREIILQATRDPRTGRTRFSFEEAATLTETLVDTTRDMNTVARELEGFARYAVVGRIMGADVQETAEFLRALQQSSIGTRGGGAILQTILGAAGTARNVRVPQLQEFIQSQLGLISRIATRRQAGGDARGFGAIAGQVGGDLAAAQATLQNFGGAGSLINMLTDPASMETLANSPLAAAIPGVLEAVRDGRFTEAVGSLADALVSNRQLLTELPRTLGEGFGAQDQEALQRFLNAMTRVEEKGGSAREAVSSLAMRLRDSSHQMQQVDSFYRSATESMSSSVSLLMRTLSTELQRVAGDLSIIMRDLIVPAVRGIAAAVHTVSGLFRGLSEDTMYWVKVGGVAIATLVAMRSAMTATIVTATLMKGALGGPGALIATVAALGAAVASAVAIVSSLEASFDAAGSAASGAVPQMRRYNNTVEDTRNQHSALAGLSPASVSAPGARTSSASATQPAGGAAGDSTRFTVPGHFAQMEQVSGAGSVAGTFVDSPAERQHAAAAMGLRTALPSVIAQRLRETGGTGVDMSSPSGDLRAFVIDRGRYTGVPVLLNEPEATSLGFDFASGMKVGGSPLVSDGAIRRPSASALSDIRRNVSASDSVSPLNQQSVGREYGATAAHLMGEEFKLGYLRHEQGQSATHVSVAAGSDGRGLLISTRAAGAFGMRHVPLTSLDPALVARLMREGSIRDAQESIGYLASEHLSFMSSSDEQKVRQAGSLLSHLADALHPGPQNAVQGMATDRSSPSSLGDFRPPSLPDDFFDSLPGYASGGVFFRESAIRVAEASRAVPEAVVPLRAGGPLDDAMQRSMVEVVASAPFREKIREVLDFVVTPVVDPLVDVVAETSLAAARSSASSTAPAADMSRVEELLEALLLQFKKMGRKSVSGDILHDRMGRME